MDEVTELLAKVGEAEIRRRLMIRGDEVVKGKIPMVFVRVEDIDGVKQAVIVVDKDPRRLVMHDDQTFSWYNAEGPEE